MQVGMMSGSIICRRKLEGEESGGGMPLTWRTVLRYVNRNKLRGERRCTSPYWRTVAWYNGALCEHGYASVFVCYCVYECEASVRSTYVLEAPAPYVPTKYHLSDHKLMTYLRYHIDREGIQ